MAFIAICYMYINLLALQWIANNIPGEYRTYTVIPNVKIANHENTKIICCIFVAGSDKELETARFISRSARVVVCHTTI